MSATWLKSCGLLLFVVSECLPTKLTRITRLAVPPEVRLDSGSVPEVVLDCEYELETDEGLVVSWHFNGDKIYQWILGRDRSFKPTEPFESHLDHEYSASDVANQEYRALRLTAPDSTFSGEYECRVSNFASEDSQRAYLQFYALGEGPTLRYEYTAGNHTDDASDDEVLVLCDAELWFPQPYLTIFVAGEMANQTQSDVSSEGLFNSTASALVSAALLESGVELRCDLTLPNTTHTANDTLAYTSGEAEEGASARSEAGATAAVGAGSPGSVADGAGAASPAPLLQLLGVMSLMLVGSTQ